jgi:uncharacterized membrane protein YdfJ with MMPL/SSD domain|tara:strand:- start:1416 stop:2258 length:843 start_codon:yes stop_codon:yes gene_type:complete
MANNIVDSDLDDEKAVDYSDLTSRLESEETTSKEAAEPEAQEIESASGVEDTEVPAKFQGKSVDDILSSYQNLEQQYGKQGNELGELRKLADTLIQKNLQEAQVQQVQQDEAALTEEDFHENPLKAVRRVVEEALQPIKGAITQTQADSTLQRLQTKHPDVEDIVNNAQFQQWVMASTPRQDMWLKASNGDFEYADELFSQYKELTQTANEKQTEKVQKERERELQAATTVSGGSSADASSSGLPVYKRTELIRLQIQDPQRYADLAPEIYKAYEQGRVR